MKNSLLALVGAAAFLHASDRANAIEIDVGGAKIEIPAPKGYVAVTSEYSVLERFMKSLVAPANLYLASFVDGESLKASDSGIPDLTRYFSVQVLRQIQSRTVSKGDFDELKELVRNQNKEILKQTEKELDKALGGVTENLKNEFDMDAALKIADFVPFDPHHEDERSYAFSILMKGLRECRRHVRESGGERHRDVRACPRAGTLRLLLWWSRRHRMDPRRVEALDGVDFQRQYCECIVG